MPDVPASDVPVSDSPLTNENAAQPGILVVDDDRMLLELLRAVFTKSGFQVWTAPAGSVALELYRQHQNDIGVVLLDVCMPVMDGPQTLAELRRVNPTVRASFMSGFTGNYTHEDLLSLGALRFFEKPFQIQTLSEQLWQLAQTEVRRSA